jgi:hypothetical protein
MSAGVIRVGLLGPQTLLLIGRGVDRPFHSRAEGHPRMCVGRLGGLEGSIVVLRRFQHAGDGRQGGRHCDRGPATPSATHRSANAAARMVDAAAGKKEPRAPGVRRRARRSASRNVRLARQSLDRPQRSHSMELGTQLCGAHLGLAIPGVAEAGKAEQPHRPRGGPGTAAETVAPLV